MTDESRIYRIVDILMRDYDAMRSEIRVAEARHEKTSFWLSSGLLAALSLCFKEEFRIGVIFLPLVILAYWGHRLYSHTLHVATLSRWIMRTERLVDKLLKTNGLLDWERHFVRIRLNSFSLFSLTPQGIIEGFLMLPSLIVFVVAVFLAPATMAGMFGLNIILARLVIWASYPSLALILMILYILLNRSIKVLDDAGNLSVEKTYKSIMNPVKETASGYEDRISKL